MSCKRSHKAEHLLNFAKVKKISKNDISVPISKRNKKCIDKETFFTSGTFSRTVELGDKERFDKE